MGSIPLDIGRLTDESRALAVCLFAAHPEWEARAVMRENDASGAFDLSLEFPSPTGDAERSLHVWMVDGVDPTIDWGDDFHTHASLQGGWELNPAERRQVWSERTLTTIEEIFAGHRLLFCRVGGVWSGNWGMVDSREEGWLAGLFGGQAAPDKVILRTWSTRDDRVVSVADL